MFLYPYYFRFLLLQTLFLIYYITVLYTLLYQWFWASDWSSLYGVYLFTSCRCCCVFMHAGICRGCMCVCDVYWGASTAWRAFLNDAFVHHVHTHTLTHTHTHTHMIHFQTVSVCCAWDELGKLCVRLRSGVEARGKNESFEDDDVWSWMLHKREVYRRLSSSAKPRPHRQ